MNSVRKELTIGVFYTAIAKYSGIFVSLVITIILARLLSPTDFGIVAIANIFIVFFSIISDLGIGPAIIQNRNLSSLDLNYLFSFTIYLGVVLGICFYFLAPIFSFYYENSLLSPVLKILSISVVFGTWNIVPNSLILKDKFFKFIAFRTFIIQVISGILSVFLAYSGGGIYSLLLSPILSSIFLFIVNISKRHLSFYFKLSLSPLKKIGSYSIYQFLFNFINYFTRNLDKLLVGKYISLGSLGYYEKSYRLMILPIQNITNVITPVIQPIFSDFQDDLKRQSNSYLKILCFLSNVGIPLTIFLFFSSREIILLVFGPQWEASITTFKILSLSVWGQLMGSSHGSILQSTNNTRLLFITGLINALINALGILVGIFIIGTIEGVAMMFVITFLLGFWNYNVIFKYALRTSVWPFYKMVFSSLLFGTFLSITLFSYVYIVDIENMLISLCCKFLVVFFLTYIYSIFILKINILNIKLLIKSLK